MNNNKVFFAATGLKLISILGLLMMPFEIGVFIEFLGLTPSQAGLVAALETSALALGVVLVSFRMVPLPMILTAAVGVVLVIGGNLVSALLTGQVELIIARCITGLGYGIANATASRTGKKRKPFTAEHRANLGLRGPRGPNSAEHNAKISAGQKRFYSSI